MRPLRTIGLALGVVMVFTGSAVGQTTADERFRDIYRQLIEINTTLSAGSCTAAAHAMELRLRSAGLPEADIRVIVPPKMPAQGNLVAVLRGSDADARAILLLAHLDVVEANRADWQRDPFTLVEENGYFYGRGTADDKAMAAIFVDTLIRFKETGYQPTRSVKLALTCGEETPSNFNGVEYLLANHRDLIEAAFALNEGGGGRLDGQGRRLFHGVQAGEKVYQDFRLELTNPGGHSSRPVADNAIYRLAAALTRVAAFEFPAEFNDVTRTFFERMSSLEAGQTASDMRAVVASPTDMTALARLRADPTYNAMLGTTCVATTLDAGHAPNALPQRARANVNCRIFPGRTQEQIRQTLEQVVADPGIAVTLVDPPERVSPPAVLTPDVLGPIETITGQMWPGVAVVPFLLAGATDGRFLMPAGVPTYGVSGLFVDPATTNLHGLNERMRVQSLFEGREFLERLIRAYAGSR
jgi:acetylornithine deacetylase/succinyl-diaminopimelate desuccinylase-like protein